MQLSFEELCRVLDPAGADPTVWHKIIDRHSRIAFFFQVDYRGKVPRLSRAVRVRPQVLYGFLETLKPTVYLNSNRVEAGFVDGILGRDYISDLDEVTRLLEGVASADLSAQKQHSDVTSDDETKQNPACLFYRQNPAATKLLSLFGSSTVNEPPKTSGKKRVREDSNIRSAKTAKPPSFLSSPDFLPSTSLTESGLPHDGPSELFFEVTDKVSLSALPNETVKSTSKRTRSSIYVVDCEREAEKFDFSLPEADFSMLDSDSIDSAPESITENSCNGSDSLEESSEPEDEWCEWQRKSHGLGGKGDAEGERKKNDSNRIGARQASKTLQSSKKGMQLSEISSRTKPGIRFSTETYPSRRDALKAVTLADAWEPLDRLPDNFDVMNYRYPWQVKKQGKVRLIENSGTVIYIDKLFLQSAENPNCKAEKSSLFLRSLLKVLFETNESDTALLMMDHRRREMRRVQPDKSVNFNELMGVGFLKQLKLFMGIEDLPAKKPIGWIRTFSNQWRSDKTDTLILQKLGVSYSRSRIPSAQKDSD